MLCYICSAEPVAAEWSDQRHESGYFWHDYSGNCKHLQAQAQLE